MTGQGAGGETGAVASDTAILLLVGGTLVGGVAIGKAAVDHVLASRAGAGPAASPAPARPSTVDQLVAVLATVGGVAYIIYSIPDFIAAVKQYAP